MTTSPPPSPVGIVGLGLMGGSLARALGKIDDAPEVVAWSREPRDLEMARDAGVIREAVATPEEVAAQSAVVVYAVPLGAILDMLEDHRGLWRPDAVLTDVTSLKAPVVSRARASGLAERFVGGHPMAGGQASGFAAARGDLFRGSTVWLTRDTGAEGPREIVADMWRSVGAVPRTVDAADHDGRMVWSSHLPQVLSNVLADVLEARGFARSDLGPGGRDMTRLAGSSPGMWLDLLDEAGPAVARALDVLGGALHGTARDLRNGRLDEVAELLESSRRWSSAPDPPEDPASGRGGTP